MNINKFLNIFLDVLFPEKCTGCKLKNTSLCALCLASIRHAERETARHILACFDYRDPVIKRALWELKYKNKKHLAEVLGQELYEQTLEDLADLRIFASGLSILVIPVPLSKERRRERGYNQAELIAKYFIKNAPAGMFEIETENVKKIKNTSPQARIANRNKRLANIKGAFAVVKPEKIKGRTCIVIDDITTTGGTITEILKLLKASGAKRALGFAAAH